ncbi:MAG TPA: hypothetical protein DCX07_15760, partial [Phycisphaerales bacterium]|nr:hypothetical protein [Phycisphaerales bacterium]
MGRMLFLLLIAVGIAGCGPSWTSEVPVGAEEGLEPERALQVIASLRGRKDDASLERLVRITRHDDIRVRHAAAWALMDAGPAAIDPLFAYRTDSSLMANIMARMGEPAIAPLVSRLGKTGASGESVIAHALAYIGPAATPQVAKMLESSDATVRKEAAEALGKIGDPQGAAVLVTALRKETSRKTAEWIDPRPAYVRALGRIRGSELVCQILYEELLSEENQRNCPLLNSVVAAMGEQRSPVFLPGLVYALERNLCPATAARELGELADPRALPYLQKAAAREEPLSRRVEAMVAMSQMGHTRGLYDATVRQLDAAKTSRERIAAIQLLGYSDDDRAVEKFLPYLRSEDLEIAGEAAEALGRLGTKSKAAVPAMIALIQDSDGHEFPTWMPDPLTRRTWRIVWALGAIEDPQAVPALARILADRQAYFWYTRACAADALGHFSEDRAVETLIAALDSRPENVRLA